MNTNTQSDARPTPRVRERYIVAAGMKREETYAISPAQAINNIKWRWRLDGVFAVTSGWRAIPARELAANGGAR